MDVVAVICYYFALLFAAEIGYACSMVWNIQYGLEELKLKYQDAHVNNG